MESFEWDGTLKSKIGGAVYAGFGGAYITVDWIKVGESFIGMREPKIEEVRRIQIMKTTTNNSSIFIITIVLIIISNIMYFETRAEYVPQHMVVQEEIHENQESIEEQYLNKFMEAIKNRDTNLLCEVWKGENEESTVDFFTDVYDFWAGREITSYKKMGEKVREENKEEKLPAGTLYGYEIISGDEQFDLSFVITNESDGGNI